VSGFSRTNVVSGFSRTCRSEEPNERVPVVARSWMSASVVARRLQRCTGGETTRCARCENRTRSNRAGNDDTADGISRTPIRPRAVGQADVAANGRQDEDTWVAISGYGPTKATVTDGGELFGRSR
jgi:hypothetical protein